MIEAIVWSVTSQSVIMRIIKMCPTSQSIVEIIITFFIDRCKCVLLEKEPCV
jgi:hypothetical protein